MRTRAFMHVYADVMKLRDGEVVRKTAQAITQEFSRTSANNSQLEISTIRCNGLSSACAAGPLIYCQMTLCRASLKLFGLHVLPWPCRMHFLIPRIGLV